MTHLSLVSVAVGLPSEVRWNGQTVLTGFFKSPVSGRVQVGATNIEGDRQADLTVHGGPAKAVYAYPAEHYPAWSRDLGLAELPWASFGENLTTAGLRETVVRIGDRYRIGTAEFMVTQPRMPCFKLEIAFGRSDMIKRFTSVDRSGFYLAVVQEGAIAAGDEIVLVARHACDLTVAEAFRMKVGAASRDRLELAASHPALAAGWRESFRRRLDG